LLSPRYKYRDAIRQRHLPITAIVKLDLVPGSLGSEGEVEAIGAVGINYK
jgi:hypothetical protein